MRKLLIAHSSEELAASLDMMLSGQFQIAVCSDGDTAQKLLQTFLPNVMILDLLLPQKDGITLLEDAASFRPEVVLATTRNLSSYTRITAEVHKIDYLMQTPCPVRHIVRRLMEVIEFKDLEPPSIREPESRATRHLQLLGIPSHMDGYIQLQLGIPLFSRDRAQKLSKELYPEIAKLGGFGSADPVERSIRCAIKAGWMHRNDSIWRNYFLPDNNGSIPCPSNKEFISVLAEVILLETQGSTAEGTTIETEVQERGT